MRLSEAHLGHKTV